MTYVRVEAIYNEEESKQPADIAPRPPLNVIVPDKDKRMTPHDLFKYFTATIILQNESFVR
ncbi:MAG: hypothetical protein ACTHMC_05925 [Pseudobacter sp.]|uniref:hypothetical protein n=1 Tax=Pseudobacter sp. TaxID=2045420 RepID=UPI003F7D96B1